MSKLYLNPKEPAAFAGLTKFKKHHSNISEDEIRNLPSYYLHYPIKRRFQQRKTEVDGINEQFQVDLLDIKKYKAQNRNYAYLMTCIDVFSKYAWVIPIKRKEADECKRAFTVIFRDAIPQYVYSDKGREFMGSCNKYLKEKGVVHLSTKSINKAAVVERFNRTLKERIWRYLSRNTNSKSKSFINILQDIVESYNSTYHEAIKTNPGSVTKHNEGLIRSHLFGDDINFIKLDDPELPSIVKQNHIRFAFNIGDYVRRVEDAEQKTEIYRFQRGHVSRWSKELYIIKQIIPTLPPVYGLYDVEEQREVERKFYKEELQKVNGYDKDTYHYLRKQGNNFIVVKVNSPNQEIKLVDQEFLKLHNVNNDK